MLYTRICADDAHIVFGPQFSSPDPEYTPSLVVVAGGSRVLNGTLSQGFLRRAEHGARLGLLLGAPSVLMTGGKNESYISRAYLLSLRDPAAVLFPTSYIRTLPVALAAKAAALAKQLSPHATLASYLASPAGAALGGEGYVVCENASRTTHQNAVETARHLRSHPPPPPIGRARGAVVVVSAPHHMWRLRVHFRRELRDANPPHVFVMAAPGRLWEWCTPRVWRGLPPEPGEGMAGWVWRQAFLRYRMVVRGVRAVECTLGTFDAVAAVREVAAVAANVVRGTISWPDIVAALRRA